MISGEERPAGIGHTLKSAAETGHIVIHIVCSAAEDVVIATSGSVVADVYWDQSVYVCVQGEADV